MEKDFISHLEGTVNTHTLVTELKQAVIGDDKEVTSLYLHDDVLMMPNFHETIRGKDAWIKLEEEAREKGRKIKSINYITEDVWECGDLIYEIGKFGMSVTHPDLKQPFANHGKYFTVWEKQKDGSLKVKIVIWNTDLHLNAINEQVKW